jgi:hypothetical protein
MCFIGLCARMLKSTRIRVCLNGVLGFLDFLSIFLESMVTKRYLELLVNLDHFRFIG